MRFIVSIILLLSILAQCKAVIEITDENFSSMVQKHDEWSLTFMQIGVVSVNNLNRLFMKLKDNYN
ncbi:unnamed protein product [Rhizopus stolonifer]